MATKAKGKSTKSAPTTKKASAPSAPQKRPIRREVGAVVCFFLALFTFIGYFDVDALFVTAVCGFLKGLLGYGFYLLPPVLLVCSWVLITHRGRPIALRTVSLILIDVMFSSLWHVLFAKVEPDFSRPGAAISALYSGGTEAQCGGLIGGLIGSGCKALFSIYGAVPVLLFVLIVLVFIAFRINPADIVRRMQERPRAEYVPEPEPEKPAAPAAPKVSKTGRRAIDIPVDDEVPETEYTEKKVGFFNVNPRVKTPAEAAAKLEGKATEKPAAPTDNVQPLSVEEAAKIAGVTVAEPAPVAAEVLPTPPAPPAPAPTALKTEEIHSAEPPAPTSTGKRSERSAEGEALGGEIAKIIEAAALEDGQEYRYPPVDLLQSGKAAAVDGREEMLINRERLQTTLESFGVDAKIVDITRGPTVTRYDLELAHGVKLNKLTNLADDLALSLGVSGVRIAPIPDKISTVGIEVPNKIVSIVYLREIISSDAFRSAPSKLTFAIGKDIGGKVIVGNIAKLPHMLIAGTTGSGKSVCMNSLILSLLFKASPDEVRLIMIDPKMVELGIYNGIPHLYVPVVTDPKKAAGALQWAVVEMLKRYRLFSEVGVRDLAGYNKIQTAQGGQTLPQVVIVIDELADLMMVASKEVEDSICRVAQMGRASGMHLVIATQRPSADVITGLMKANIPSRIAFAVSSGMESRIILDTQGAEKLVGNGDMLYHPLGSSKPTRIQGAFVTDEERETVINFIKQNSEPQYNEDIEAQIEQVAEAKSAKEPEPEESGGFSEYDELLPQAVEVIFETKQASVSMLQRRLKLGYSRAARIVDQMEELGIVGPFEGSKPRQIVMTREQWEEISSGGASAVPADAADDFTTADPEEWDD